MSSKPVTKKTHQSSKEPTFMSSKKPVSRLRQIVDVPKKNSRDPRFEHISGKFNEDLFKKSYSFVEDMKNDELKELKKSVNKTKDLNLKKQLKQQLETELAKKSSEKQKEDKQKLKRELRKNEMKLIKDGKKPFFLKKSDMKQIELTQKFNDLKGKVNIDKLLEKRRKRNANKDHKALPFKRRQMD